MNNNPYFKTEIFKDGLCRLNFDTTGNNYIELLMPSKTWNIVDENTSTIESVDIETDKHGILVNFVDGDKYKPYTVYFKFKYTNLNDSNFTKFDLERISQRKHRMKIYTEQSNEPVAEFENVKALTGNYQLTKLLMDNVII